MLKSFYIKICLALALCPWVAYAQDTVAISVRPYVGLRGQLAVYDQQMELQENASRAGITLNVKRKGLSFIASGEVQLSMFRGGTSFNTDGNLSGGFLTVQSEQTQQVFGNRLGYMGLDFDKYGTLTIGKQWSVYRDVSSYTDRLNVFGGRASATFIGGTDGGENGTGRADQSIIYRNRIGPLYLGGQIQARGGNNNRFIDGFGLSTQIEVNNHLYIGAAFNRAFLSEGLLNGGQVLGLLGQPTYFSMGVKYIIGTKLEFSVLGAVQKNGDFVQGFYIDPLLGELRPTVVFDAKGLELFGKYKLNNFSVLVGYNLYITDVDDIYKVAGYAPIHTGFGKNDIIAGVAYLPVKFVQLYTEQRISLGKNVIGEKEKNVFTMGMKIELSKAYKVM